MHIRVSWSGSESPRQKLLKCGQSLDNCPGAWWRELRRRPWLPMKTYSISKLARTRGLSRSTLLYYDRLGLLKPSGRTGSGYRYYTDADQRRLKRIFDFREAGLTLKEIRAVLSSGG